MSERVPVMVTTDNTKRGVFFGYAVAPVDYLATEIELFDFRMCVYWSADTHGVFGLASKGPGADCRVSPSAPHVGLTGITSIADCTPEAVEAWESEPWGE